MFNQNPMAMPMIQFQAQNQNEMKREEIIRPYKEIIKQLEKENERLTNENNQLKNQLKQYQMNNLGNQMNPMNNMGNMGMINNQNNMMNQMNNMGMMNNQNNMMNQMNPMNNMGNMGMMNNQNNMMNQMNPMNNMGNMGMINNQFNMMNLMNRNIMNSHVYQMCNQMNFVGNQMMPRMQMGNESQYNIRYLSIKVKMEDGTQILVQNKSDDKMEKAISNFCTKAVIQKKDDYDFFVIKEKKAKFDSTVEENGIIGNDDYILAKKKIIRNENNNSNDINKNNIQIKKVVQNINVVDPIIKGIPISLRFRASTGVKAMIQIGLKNTFREAAIKFCNRINVNPSLIGVHLIFLKNAEKIDLNDYKTLEQIGIKNYYIITVIDNVNIYGA